MTPIRVLHRRALATRPRTVHWMKAKLEPDSNRMFTLQLETQAGLLVSVEFMCALNELKLFIAKSRLTD